MPTLPATPIAAPSTTLARLLPAGAVCVELTGRADPQQLHPLEAASLAPNCAPKRQADFAAGRLCARQGLGQLGLVDFALLPGDDRRPQWPSGYTGSITHSGNYCASAVARTSQVQAIGIDAEVINKVRPNIARKIATPAEREWLQTFTDSRQQQLALALIFSAKEAFYKCQYELSRNWLGFHGAQLLTGQTDWQQGEFSLQLITSIPALPAQQYFSGRFAVHGQHIISAISIS